MKKLKLEELGRISAVEYRSVEKLPIVLVLDNIRSLHNVGSAFRTADAFRIEKIFLTGITGTPPHREIQKTALGATESVPWEHMANDGEVIVRLRAEGFKIVVVEQTTESQPLQDFVFDQKMRYALVFGNEVNGVSEPYIAAAEAAIEVPQAGSKHSLNVSVCLGIVTWQAFRSIQLPQ
jgi:23S rRNA (guanosine2251-2'-O)-methyltransferase